MCLISATIHIEIQADTISHTAYFFSTLDSSSDAPMKFWEMFTSPPTRNGTRWLYFTTIRIGWIHFRPQDNSLLHANQIMTLDLVFSLKRSVSGNQTVDEILVLCALQMEDKLSH